MKNLLKVVTIVSTLALIVGATMALTFSAAAELQEIVLIDQDFSKTVTITNYGQKINNDDLDAIVQKDIVDNGYIEGNEYYLVTTTGSVSGGSGYSVAGFFTGDNEFWGDDKAEGCVAIGANNGTYTQKFAADAKDKKGNLLAPLMSGKSQLAYFSDANPDDGFTDTVTISHIKVVVYRADVATSSEEESTTEKEPSAATSEEESVVEPSEEPSQDESIPDASEDESIDESNDTPSDILPGDAVADGNLDMKDVLAIRKVIAKMEVEGFNAANADFNGDSALDMKDVLGLRRQIAGL